MPPSHRAGQLEFYVSHELFLGGSGSIFVVMCRLGDEDWRGSRKSLEYWLRFIASSCMPTPPPIVVLVANVIDSRRIGDAREWLNAVGGKLRAEFQGFLNIHMECIALNCKDSTEASLAPIRMALQVYIYIYII